MEIVIQPDGTEIYILPVFEKDGFHSGGTLTHTYPERIITPMGMGVLVYIYPEGRKKHSSAR